MRWPQDRDGFQKRLLPALIALALLCGAAFWLQQSWRSDPDLDLATPASRNLRAQAILSEAIAIWRNMAAASGQIQITSRREADDGPTTRTAVIAYDFERPNRLRCRIRDAEQTLSIACDGRTLSCRIEDPVTRKFKDQLVQLDGSGPLTIPSLYKVTEFLDPERPHELLSALMELTVPLQYTILGPLLRDGSLAALAADGQIAGSDEVSVNGVTYHRLNWKFGRDLFQFWIETKTGLLLRMRIPLEAQTGDPPAFVTVEFSRPEIPAADTAYHLELADDEQRLQYFVLRREMQTPPALAKPVGGILFTALDGSSVTLRHLQSDCLVLAWFQNHSSSQYALQLLSAMQRSLGNRSVEILGVCTEPVLNLSNQALSQLMRQWNVTIPVVRDLRADGRDLLGILRAPTLVILDRERVVQLIEEGVDSDLSESLPLVLDRVLSGEDLAAAYLKHVRDRRARYANSLAAASIDRPILATDLKVELAARSDPRLLHIEQIWSTDPLRRVGPVLVVQSTEGDSIFVSTEGPTMVELGFDGTIIRRHHLAVPDDTVLQRLRVAVDSSGRRYFAAVTAAAEVFLFDSNWRARQMLSGQDGEQQNVQDLRLCDLDADGLPELYVAFGGAAPRVTCFDLAGRSKWSRRLQHAALSLEYVSARDGKILLTAQNGRVYALTSDGQSIRQVDTGAYPIHFLFHARLPTPSRTLMCGLSHSADGSQTAIGLSRQLTEMWSAGLPSGTMDASFPLVVAGQLFDRSSYQWLLASLDGTIHVIGEDGRLLDHWSTGERVAGLGTISTGTAAVLVIAAGDRVSGYRVAK